MKNPSNISEFLVIGFITSLTLGFLGLLIYDLPIPNFQTVLKNLSNSEIVLYTFIIYVIGMIGHRIMIIAKYETLKKILEWKLFRVFFSKRQITFVNKIDREKWHRNYVYVMQFGSNAVINQFTRGRVF